MTNVKTRGTGSFRRILGKIGQLPHALLQLFKHQSASLVDFTKVTDSFKPIPLPAETIRRLEQSWIQQLQLQQVGIASSPLTSEEKLLLQQIQEKTKRENRNNVTRTKAYWSSYLVNPELHWALLAHMVSRNGGWCMTDLQGDMLPHLMNEEQKEHVFAFLERANGLIFKDAYSQLLLYAESKKRKRSLFHLLPFLGVSAWMEPVWLDFWTQRESAALTISLIINEQNYIEKRIVQNHHYQTSVLHTPLFKTQAWLQLNQVCFPFGSSSVAPTDPNHDMASPSLPLAGLILENFADLTERIAFGKSLYAILFGIPAVFQGVVSFAEATPHTGSRSDYWPHLYAPIRKAPPEVKYQERLHGCVLKKDAAPFYSPPLDQAWPDRNLASVEPGDWFVDVKKPLLHMRPIAVPIPFDLTNEACVALNKIELGILALQTIKLP
ncbi:DUF2515 domain-containing protein [Paenibacillus sp. SYP-B3998]|uniref:DUF2515 domain-containing protein n=1 Tax=Paenibacillus sp. SYP-B3998 TaxID=2678564 RepID=A0A6G4A1W6_9BACL|nr:DUF2515 family protein [Paenibacillus sp. SYP-B3998]NEW08463.1 DUF2515 domain-containing protein [Paenibacillus sp. SYP-B3998]